MKKFVLFYILLLALASFQAFAQGAQGDKGGNGGVSIVCRNKSQKIISAELLDIYEGRILYGRKYELYMDTEEQIQRATERVAVDPTFLSQFKKALARARAIMTFIPKGNSLLVTNDAFPRFKKDGCTFEQLANYSEDELLVSEEIYAELDDVNKAALLVHEAIYAVMRMRGETDSINTRKLTSQVMAENPSSSVIYKIVAGKTREGKQACGLSGSIQERIRSCNTITKDYQLITRTRDGDEIYKDIGSGLIWSDVIGNMTFDKAYDSCKKDNKHFAGIKEVTWKLPSKQDFLKASKIKPRTGILERIQDLGYSLPKKIVKNGILKYLPNRHLTYWTDTLEPSRSTLTYFRSTFDMLNGEASLNNVMKSEWVRCVGIR